MINGISITWIDDEPTHQKDADILEEKMKGIDKNVEVNFYHPREFEEKIGATDKIDLFLVDDKLDRCSFEGEKYRGKGISYLGLIRENYPDIPVYLFSVDPKAGIYKELAYISEREADGKLKYTKIQDNGHTILYYDALDYKKIRNSFSKGLDEIINLLKAPNIEKEKITGLLPHILKITKYQGVKTELIAGRSQDFTSWVRKVLMNKPGFLYDKLYSATFVGMTKKAFKKRMQYFDDALYKGIFSETLVRKLWWKAILRDIVIRKAKEKADKEKKTVSTVNIQKISKYAFDLTKNEVAKCVFCKTEFPDAIGVKTQDGKKEPVHFRCSKDNPNETKMLFFDELRLISKKLE